MRIKTIKFGFTIRHSIAWLYVIVQHRNIYNIYNQLLSRNSKVFGYLYDSNFCGPAVLILMSAI